MDEKNPLVKHQILHHQGEVISFIFKVDKTWRTSLSRQIRESLMINQEDPSKLINSKSEWGAQNGVPRITIVDDRPDQSSTPNNSSPLHQTQTPLDLKKHPLQGIPDLNPNKGKRPRTLAPPEVLPTSNIMNHFKPNPNPNASFSQGKVASERFELNSKSSTSAEPRLGVEITIFEPGSTQQLSGGQQVHALKETESTNFAS